MESCNAWPNTISKQKFTTKCLQLLYNRLFVTLSELQNAIAESEKRSWSVRCVFVVS